jgi:hypothetical protein
MRLDRKFLLIAATAVLVLIVAGMFYTATRLRQIVAGTDGWATRDAYVTSVQRGERQIAPAQAIQLVRLSLDAEQRRTAAIAAARELTLTLAWMTLGCCALLAWTIRRMPRTEPLRGPVLFGSSGSRTPEAKPS